MVLPTPIRINTGGVLDPDLGQIWDRDQLIAELWRTLEVQSVYFAGERRMGKTSVISKMRAAAPPGMTIVYVDVEGGNSAGDFATLLYGKVTTELPALARARGLMVRGFKKRFGISKLKVGPASFELTEITKKHWPEVLDEIVSAIDKSPELGVAILCFDELPQLLQNIVNQGEPLVARQLLDKLRELRQTHSRVRMMFTGSIGLHHVERQLRESGSAWEPINDLKKIDIPPFSPYDAEGLAAALLTNESIPCDDQAAVAAAVAESSDGVPYYIHWIVDGLRRQNTTVTSATGAEVVRSALGDPDDAWGLRHQVTRVPEYYGADADLAYAVLDAVALTPGIAFDELMRILPAHVEIDDRDGNRVRALLEFLERDHYLDGGGGTLRFRRALMQEAWKAKRYLA